MQTLLTSRRFWTFVVAQIISIVGVILAHYFTDPFVTQLVGMGIIFVEGLAGFLIAAYTVDDLQKIRSAANVEIAKANNPPPVKPL
jgi:hypothetical protein